MTMEKFIFLTSSNYSGSTLLAFMMGCHSRIVTISELTGIVEKEDLMRYRCSCGKIIIDCDFWREVSRRMQNLHKDFSYKNFGTNFIPKTLSLRDRLQFSNLRNNRISDLRDYIYQKIPRYNQYIHGIAKRNADLSRIICDITHKDIFFDAAKRPTRIKFLKQHLQCEFKVIHLVKDGRGVFDSYKRYNPKLRDSKAILLWKNTNKHIERALRYVEKENRFYLRYKDLAKNPEREFKNLCDFIGVPYSSKILDFRNFDHHIIGNTKMRLGSSNEIYYDDKWRRSLTSEQLKVFERLAGRMNRKYGSTLR